MKKLMLIIAVCLVVLASCTSVKTVTKGLENESFLEFVGKPKNFPDGVAVSVDDTINFTATVNKDHADRPKGNVYAISTGTHTVTVSYNNNVIYKKQIFVSAQETKKIVLP